MTFRSPVTFRRVIIVASTSLLVGLGTLFFASDDSQRQNRVARGSIGDVANLEAAYARWAAAYSRNGGDRELILPLGYSKGLSAEFTKARGQAKFDLVEGSVSVVISGLPEGAAFDVWLIDNRSGPGRSVRPESGDTQVRLGSLLHAEDAATLEVNLAESIFPGFEIDLLTITRGGETPEQGGLLFGSASLFQKLYYSQSGGAFAALGDVVTPRRFESGQPAPWTLPFRALIPRPAFAVGISGDPDLDQLVSEGELIFFNETFDGNGRTCGTCHRADNNFTIDPAFIATLPDDDPLFVAEFISALSENFENPTLMRKFGLTLENQDGFNDPETNFNMRSVQHTLALTVSIDSVGGPRTGWGGDATLVDGLRDFATGAVTQHFPLSLGRTAGVDFRLPTDDELDRLEAFQLSLGRQEDLSLPLELKGLVPAAGQDIFLDGDDGGGKCNVCHANAGANTSFGTGNGNFNTGVENLPNQPADLTDELVPADDGFGTTGDDLVDTFNSPPLVEAADTGPFFHNNAIGTIEGAVAFYTSAAFNDSPSGEASGGIDLDATDIEAVAAFLRVINALENIRSAIALEERALDQFRRNGSRKLYKLALAENADAIQVLSGGGLHPEAVNLLQEANALLQPSSRSRRNRINRRALVKAIEQQEAARDLIVAIDD